MSKVCTLVIIGLLAIAGHFASPPVTGGEPCNQGACPTCEAWPAIHCGCCPDTYCVKRLPPVPCLPPCCSGYCYCAKPLPPVPKCCEPWYRCLGRGCKNGGAKTR